MMKEADQLEKCLPILNNKFSYTGEIISIGYCMKDSKRILVLMMVVSWISLLFVGKQSLKRFFLSSLFMAVLVRIVNVIAKKRRWWWYTKIHPALTGSFPFVWGPFFVSSFWFLKFSYGKIMKYIGLNLSSHVLFTYILEPILKRLGIASLVRMEKKGLMYVFATLASLLYGFQYASEKILTNKEASS